ncbi:MAG: Na+/H+ antiporter NhaA [Gemmatimonadetes bacterium]|nr:Na+/H+ antiporter NhaA [Gemmatimonadota bacterium]
MAPPASRGMLRAFQEFFRLEAAGGILLLVCMATALGLANSPWAESYSAFWHTTITIGVGKWIIAKDLVHWVNDGLMAVFFFVIGLEIKREVLVGELASPRQAALPAAAALGGMVVPASIFLAFNLGGPTANGWGIPMATDIAFALGVLALLGDRVPLSLKVFLAALAIVDDLGAVLVIALFYTAEVSWHMLAAAAAIFGAMVVLNLAGVRRPAFYGVLGALLWVAFLQSGVHPTIAGILAALTIPATARINTGVFRAKSREILDRLETVDVEPNIHPLTGEQQEAVYGLASLVEQVETPLQRLEHALHPWVIFFIMPIFALANAGVTIGSDLGDALVHPVSIGVILGLVVGKLVGVTGFAWLAVTSGIATRPRGMTWRQLIGAAALAGIGFTMSLFIADQAFGTSYLLDYAKIGVLVASLVAGVVGVVILAGGKARS